MRQQLLRRTKHSDEGDRMSPLLGLPEAAELLGISVWTLSQWLSQRRIAFIKVGRLTKLRQADIEAFIERNRKEAILWRSEALSK